MASVFIVDNTDGTLSLVMEPGSLNGPGSGTRDSDLRLYGMGALLWGEGMNENVLRIAENFACEEKAGSPGVPQDEGDLGPGRGITTPLIGQTWFNKTDETLYYYNGTLWLKSSSVTASATQPTTAEEGDLWYENSGTSGPCGTMKQLMVFNGTDWDSVADAYLPLCGGILSGGLDMSTNKIWNIGYPSGSTDVASKQYVDDREASILGSLSTHVGDYSLHLTAAQNQIMNSLEGNLGGADPTTTGLDLSKMIGFNAAFGGTRVHNVMNTRLNKTTTDTVSAGHTIVLGRAPNSGSNEAATAAWVEAEIGATGAGGGDRIVKYWNTLSGSAQSGDIHVDGSGRIWIRASGNWRQVYPAQYS